LQSIEIVGCSFYDILASGSCMPDSIKLKLKQKT
jgi:hypothetical protein